MSRRTAPLGIRLVAVAFGALLAWGALTHALSRLTLPTDPEQALSWQPSYPDAALRAGERLVQSQPDMAAVFAGEALRHGPIYPDVMRLFALIAARQRELDRADAFMAAELRRSLRNTPAQMWTFRRALLRQDFAAAFKAADAILRRRPEELKTLLPLSMPLLDRRPEARDALAERFRWAPSWRAAFLRTYIAAASSDEALSDFLQAMERHAAAATDAEFDLLLRRLIRARDYQKARDAWMQRLTPDEQAPADLLYDGGFEAPPRPFPFSWTIASGGGVTATVQTASNRQTRALYIDYAGTGASRSIATQMLALPPGQYRLTGEVLHQTALEVDRLTWVVNCDRGGGQLARLRQTSQTGMWSPFAVDFTVTERCAAQHLTLRNFPGDTLAPILAWYDNLAIVRLGDQGSEPK